MPGLIWAGERANLGQVLPSRSRIRFASWCALFGVVFLAAEGCAGRLRPNTPSATTPPERALPVTVTAYCTGKATATGKRPTEQTVAADPDLLPIGSRIRVSGLDKRYNRTYVVMDTGSKIRGRRIDLYMRDCREAVAFGRRSGSVTVLR